MMNNGGKCRSIEGNMGVNDDLSYVGEKSRSIQIQEPILTCTATTVGFSSLMREFPSNPN
jgi:hypothetical protein